MLAGEASASIFTGLADGMGKTVLLLVEVDGLTFMSAIESVTFWFSESVEGRRVEDELGIVGFSIIFSSVGKTGDAGAGAGLVSRDCFSLKQTEIKIL